ncbi:MAG TPA: four helix bundle protein [Elusimicrobiota bacterium]|nr:four helix bundle protein [Elusimicrobiota bacterium]
MITTHRELRAYQTAFKAACEIFVLTKTFPMEEKYSMVDQIRRSSRSVCANIIEAWRKRRYRAAFVAKLNDAEGEAGESQFWLEMALSCGYLANDNGASLDDRYDHIISQLVVMIENPDPWLLR